MALVYPIPESAGQRQEGKWERRGGAADSKKDPYLFWGLKVPGSCSFSMVPEGGTTVPLLTPLRELTATPCPCPADRRWTSILGLLQSGEGAQYK